jgi:hypothetical protein
MQTGRPLHVANPFVRIGGAHLPGAQVLAHALAAATLPIRGRNGSHIPDDQDPTQVDLALHTEPPKPREGEPAAGVGYAGLTLGQRYAFLQWVGDPAQPAPLAFRQLYIAHLEVFLLEDEDSRHLALRELRRLTRLDGWRGGELAARATILGFWLAGDGGGLAAWLAETALSGNLLSVGLGCQGLLNTPLQSEQIPTILETWRIGAPELSADVIRLRLASLATALSAEPLASVLAALPEQARSYRPWRCAHRDLRIEAPQPDVRPLLEPMLRDMVAVVDVVELPPAPLPDNEDNAESMEDLGWRLILEFGHSRSDLYTWVLQECQRMPDYLQLMDENRKVVHRVIFRKSEMRRFWRLWQYIQNWASTRVYVNGEELEKWKIWPYSQYIR